MTNKNVLDYAKEHKNSELYKYFEWDDTKAGENFRLIQASKILTSISIVSEDGKHEPIRAYVSIKKQDEIKEYKSIVKVMENDEEYNILLDKAERDFISYKEKYNNLIKMKDLKNIIFKNLN